MVDFVYCYIFINIINIIYGNILQNFIGFVMKIFALSDIHSCLKHFKKIYTDIKNADVVIISGDITRHGSRCEAFDVLSEIETHNRNILAVHGNIDTGDVHDLLEEKGYNLHGKCKVLKDIAFFGVGGSTRTPMKTASEYSEEQIACFLDNGAMHVGSSQKNILVSHVPPFGMRDRTFFGKRAGSKSIKNFLAGNHVDLCISGHIHEAKGFEKFNNSVIVNPGSFRRGKYSIIEIGDGINVNLAKV